MMHAFDIDVAQEVGVEAAILFANICHWVTRNQANGDNIRDGQAWVYNSRAAWCELFPYLGEKQIRNALERLVEAKLVLRENFSFGSVNRTYWYGLAERAKPYLPKGPNLSSAERAKPITVVDTDIDSTVPPVSPNPTKASRRATPIRSLTEFLEPLGGLPPAEWGEWAFREFGWNEQRISFEWADFHDYWTSGNAKGGGRKADWYATWRNHCRMFAHNSSRGQSPVRPGTGGHSAGGAGVRQSQTELDARAYNTWQGGACGAGADGGTLDGLPPGLEPAEPGERSDAA